MKKNLLEKLLKDINNVHIAIIGDFCLDAYWFIDESKSEVSVETGQKTRPVQMQKYSLGGAGNVAANLAAMGVGKIYAFGTTGIDPFSIEMRKIMRDAGIYTDFLLTQEENFDTHVYAKPYTGNHEEGRIDFGNFNCLTNDKADELLNSLVNLLPQIDAVIINEQVLSGIHTPYFRNKLADITVKFSNKIFIADSRHYNEQYKNTIRKMNDSEAAILCGIKSDISDIVSYSDACHAASMLFEQSGKPVFITRGSNGSIVIDNNGITDIQGLMILSRVDTVGAGDSYLSGIAAALAAGYDNKTAAYTGSYVAGVTVQKLFQTGTASPKEILHIGADPDYIYAPDLAVNIRQAKYVEDSEIEIIRAWNQPLNIRHAVFDHDGTISTLREGWEHIMAPMMIRAILGKHHDTVDNETYKKVETRVREFIDKTTGIQTLAQMKGLLNIITDYNFVVEGNMLDEFGYKAIFNDELLNMVRAREEKFENGELAIHDLTIKNAVPFLKELHQAGVKLYLASGTDENDVIEEARALNYEYLFEGRIYGGVGDLNREAKKEVLNHIMTDIGDSDASQVITFGDGPVEMRETRKRGGLTVGVASNELRRYGLNPEKRTRLIKAGADIIIPDFSQHGRLFSLLNIYQ